MILRIEQDHHRFKQIIRGKIKQDLRKYISRGELIGRRGKELISIPLPQISIPHFVHGSRQAGGVGQGEGDVGTVLGAAESEDGSGQAGDAPGQHILEVEVSLDDLAEMLGEELELPRIEPRGKKNIVAEKSKYTGIAPTGPESLRHFRRTYKEMLKRSLASGTYRRSFPAPFIIREDKRYRTWRPTILPETTAAILYMMDVSGSMGEEQKEIVRIESFWIDTWLRHHYKGLEIRYIIHDAEAREVDQETFYHTRESGGTVISSAYRLALDITRADYPSQEWNVYCFHFSDGDNWSQGDTQECVRLLREDLIPSVNLFCYGQVESPYGTGQFLLDLKEAFPEEEAVALSKIESKESIHQSIKEFLGEGPMSLSPLLASLQKEIEKQARSYGLDFFQVIFEVLDYRKLNQVAAYGGFPTRYPHWRFGMEFEQLQKGYTFGLQRIYEMVINNDPCYAYLLECNADVDQKIVMAHVYAHCDFFKNNAWFSKTNRKMMDEMANHATRVRRYMDRHGVDKVENFIDICLSIENLIDPHSLFIVRERPGPEPAEPQRSARRLKSKEYMQDYINPPDILAREEKRMQEAADRKKTFPEEPTRDVLKFLIENSPLENWQRDILSIVREEAYYFAPQAQTKILNEGWATYWHSKIMTERCLTDAEVIDYADHHSGTVATHPGRLNPYKLGVELYRDIEERWNKGRFGKEFDECEDLQERSRWDKDVGQGREKIFEVRRFCNDVTFIDNYLTEEFCRRHKMFVYDFNPKTGLYQISSRSFREIKLKLLFQLTNRGLPFMEVVDGNYRNKGELLLRHRFEGVPLRMDYARETLRNVQRIWQRPACLSTMVEDKPKLISFTGESFEEADLHEPAA